MDYKICLLWYLNTCSTLSCAVFYFTLKLETISSVTKERRKYFFPIFTHNTKHQGFFLLLFTVSKSRILHRSHLKVLVLHNSNSVHIGLYVTLALSSVPQTYSLLMTIKSTCSSCSHGPICKSEGFFVFKHRLAWNI